LHPVKTERETKSYIARGIMSRT